MAYTKRACIACMHICIHPKSKKVGEHAYIPSGGLGEWGVLDTGVQSGIGSVEASCRKGHEEGGAGCEVWGQDAWDRVVRGRREV